MRGHGAPGRRPIAFAAALALHTVLGGAYLLAPRSSLPMAEPPVVRVWLASPQVKAKPPPREPPFARRERRDDGPPQASLPPVLHAPATSESPALPSGPFTGPAILGDAFRLRRNCLEGSTDERVREACEKMYAGRPGPDEGASPHVARSAGKESDFARTVRKKEAFRTYRQTGNIEDYPGLRCAFGRDCEAKGRSPP